MWLAITTAHDACSAALIDNGTVLAAEHEVIARGHDARLAPMIQALMAGSGGRPQRIAVDLGPGSFTGIRVGLATAAGLGLGWGVPVVGYAGDRAVALAALAHEPADAAVLVLLDARRGELFGRVHRRSGPEGEPVAIGPEAAMQWAGRIGRVAGNGAAAVGRPAEAAADAAAARLISDADWLEPLPIYVRAPDVNLPR
ncbi:MAG: tRNA (adenosine(37)-N6)-threonylcarbamoyltransferase complex dimerization subunit type 1 TsaB [Sphingomonadaceae bacterium]|nr:tRNA (adenosine(37)-N6)-threonylcarbamoyltransferase complex dimerization subunit type 1 TsaB [Sphingomonadaceae bacterium]